MSLHIPYSCQSIADYPLCLKRLFPLMQGWPMYAQLLIDLFKYLAPFLRNVELNKPMQILYKVLIQSFLQKPVWWFTGSVCDLAFVFLCILQGNTSCAACPATRLPRIPVRLPLWLLRRHPAQLHPAEEPDPECLPPQHEASRPLHP